MNGTGVTSAGFSRRMATRPLLMFGPDFPFAYDDYLAHPAGLGSIPTKNYGTQVAVIGGGLSGIVAAYELMKLGLQPVVFEADQLGGRLRTHYFRGLPNDVHAELGAMRFPLASTSLFHYINKVGLKTAPFPNPLSAASPSTLIDLEGQSYYGRRIQDFPKIFRDVAQAWQHTLEDQASLCAMQQAIRQRDTPTIKRIWDKLVETLDGETFYGFLSRSRAFSSFRWKEIFGQVGFGTGGWDSDFPSSILEVLRVVYTGADENQHSIVGGSVQLPLRLWNRAARHAAYWPAGTSLATLHKSGKPLHAVARLQRNAEGGVIVTDVSGCARNFKTAIFTAQTRTLLSNIACDRALLPSKVWSAIERTYFMGSSKLFVPVDRPFWLDLDPATGRDMMSMTLTDRMLRSVYLLGSQPDRPAVICLSYTWADDSLKWLPLNTSERGEVALRALQCIYPGLDIRKHVIGAAASISWEAHPYSSGAFKMNRPGHYRYQRRLFTQFMQDDSDLTLAGDGASWTAGWCEGAVQTSLNAISGVVKRYGGSSSATNPGPGDVFSKIAPLDLYDIQSV